MASNTSKKAFLNINNEQSLTKLKISERKTEKGEFYEKSLGLDSIKSNVKELSVKKISKMKNKSIDEDRNDGSDLMKANAFAELILRENGIFDHFWSIQQMKKDCEKINKLMKRFETEDEKLSKKNFYIQYEIVAHSPYWTMKDILTICFGRALKPLEYYEGYRTKPLDKDTFQKYSYMTEYLPAFISGIIKDSITNRYLKLGVDVFQKGEFFTDSEDNRIKASSCIHMIDRLKEVFGIDFPLIIPYWVRKITEKYDKNVTMPCDESEKMLLYTQLRSELFSKIEAGITKSSMLKKVKKKATQTIKDGVCTYYRYIVDNQEIIVNANELSCIVGMLVKQDNEKLEKIKQKFREHKD